MNPPDLWLVGGPGFDPGQASTLDWQSQSPASTRRSYDWHCAGVAPRALPPAAPLAMFRMAIMSLPVRRQPQAPPMQCICFGFPPMAILVVDGAVLTCSFGASPSSLAASPASPVH